MLKAPSWKHKYFPFWVICMCSRRLKNYLPSKLFCTTYLSIMNISRSITIMNWISLELHALPRYTIEVCIICRKILTMTAICKMVEGFQIFVCAPSFVTNTLIRKFRSWYDIQLAPRWGGGTRCLCSWQGSSDWERFKGRDQQRLASLTPDPAPYQKQLFCNKCRRTNENLKTLYHFADSRNGSNLWVWGHLGVWTIPMMKGARFSI